MEDPLSLIADPFGPAPGPRPFELGTTPRPRPSSLISDPLEGDRLQAAARRAPSTTPDQAARVLRLQRRTGFPVELIERNLDAIEQQTAAATFDAERFRTESPLLARWLADHPSRLALAQDDLRPLTTIERTLGIGRNLVGAVGEGAASFGQQVWGAIQAGAETLEAGRGLRAGEVTALSPTEEQAFQAWATANQITDVDHPDSHYDYRGFFKATGGQAVRFGVDHFPDTFKQHGHPTFSVESQYSHGPVDGGTWQGETFIPQSPSVLARLSAFAAGSAAVAGHLAERAKGPQTGAGFVERSIYSGVSSAAQMAPSLLLGAVAGPEALLGLVGLTTAGGSYTQARAQGVGVGKALAFSGIQGGVEVATELIPAHRLLGDLAAKSGLLTTIAHQLLPEIGGEEIATVFQDLNEWAFLPENKDRTFGDYLRERPSAAAATAISTITAVGATTVLAHGTARVLEQLSGAARDSKTIGRAPEEVRALVDQITADGPLASVGLPVETFTSYFQSRNIDPARMAAQLTGDPAAYARARQTGEDLAVPMGRYLTDLAATEHGAYFAQEARLTPNAPNIRETQALEAQAAAAVQAVPAETAATGQVRDLVLGQLEQVGVPLAQARVYAEILGHGFEAIGVRSGLDPLSLYNRYGLTVQREGFAAAPPVPVQTADTVAEPLPDVSPSVARPEDSPAQRDQRRRSHWAELLAVVLRDAQTVDPTVDPQTIRAEFAARRDRFEETEALGRESGRDPETLLRAIAKAGGLGPEAGGGMPGEVAALKAGATFGAVQGIPKVFRAVTELNDRGAPVSGLSFDDMLTTLRQDARFSHLETVNDLIDAVDDAVRHPLAGHTLPGTAEIAKALGIRLGSAWWAPRTATAIEDTVFFQGERGAIRFGSNRQFRIDLLKDADKSTFIHEGGHFYLEVLGDVVDELSARPLDTLTDTQRRMLSDYGTVLQWLGVENRAQIGEAQHEQWARGFEAYLLENAAPSPALRSVFARVRAWLVDVYRSAGRLRVELTPDVRAVMDRLLASDDAIAAAEADQHVEPLFTDAIADAAGLSAADRDALRTTVQAASDQARDTLQAKLLAQLRRERAASWREERSTLREQVARDVAAQPVYRALALLQRGTLPDGSPLPAGTEAFKLSQGELVEQFGDGVLKRLPRPLVYTRNGVAPSVAAELLGFPSSTALVVALVNAPPIAQAIDAATDAEMTRRHGDLLIDGALPEQARQAVVEARADLFAEELKHLAAAATRQPGARLFTAPPVNTLRAIATRRIAETPIRNIRPGVFAAAARRASDAAAEAAGRQDFAAALQAKQRQVLNAELYRAATAARETVDAAIDAFKPIFGRDAALAARYNFDMVQAARSLLGQFGLAPAGVGPAAHTYLDQVARYDPELHKDLEAAITAAAQPGRPYRELTLDEFTALRDGVENLWHLARRSRQIVIDGQKRDLDEVRGELEARLQAVGVPSQRRGYDRAVTRWEKAKLGLMGWRAAFRRVESWVDAIDSGDPRGAFRRLLFTPISEAASEYRVSKRNTLEQYLATVQAVEPTLSTTEIAAPEIGYTFSGTIELLHALLHTGNPSNLSKLLRGRHWGEEGPDGTLDTSRWDAFLRRQWQSGTLTKAHYDYVQAVWDQLEALKPEAQRVHHDLYGYYFAEITAAPVVTPYGVYRGGYMPAIVDPTIANDAAQRADKEALEATPTSFMFPTTGRGFTKGRVEPYARPLALDLRMVPAHLDKVLRFVHLQPPVRDAGRLVIDRAFRRTLDQFDPTVAGELIVPWLQRAARQTIDQAGQGHGGRAADQFWRALRRRSGLNVMAGNAVNALQQVTGLSVAAVKVPPVALARAFVTYLRAPRVLAADVAEKSAFMATRETTQTIEVQQHINDLLLNPTKYESLRAFTQKHGYLLSSMTQNFVDLITWSGAYDHAGATGATETEAVRTADAAVRLTQGTFNPEDLSAAETGRPFARAFLMFYSYYNMKANLLGSEFSTTIREQGLKAGAGRLLFVFTFGHLLEATLGAVLVDALAKRLPGQSDDGEDQVLAGWLSWFFANQGRAVAGLVPGGQVATALVNTFATKQRDDDKISVSPAVRAIEDSVRAPSEVYDAILHDGPKKRAVRDALTAIGLLTGLPTGALARPLGYLADVVEGKTEPSGPADAARGLVVGR